jgi:hypothetical protein
MAVLAAFRLLHDLAALNDNLSSSAAVLSLSHLYDIGVLLLFI